MPLGPTIPMFNPTTPEHINEVWNRYALTFDDLIGGTKEDFELFMQEGTHEQDILNLLKHFEPVLMSQPKAFESLLDYSWSLNPVSYRMSAEAAFQFRVIKLILAFKEGINEKYLKRPIVVREAICTGIIQPKTISREGLNFIILPVGWFEFLNLLFQGLQCLRENDIDGVKRSILGVSAKVLAEKVLENYLSDNPFWLPRPNVITYLKLELAKSLVDGFPVFTEATFGMENHSFDPLSDHMMTLCESFFLAHEIGHILLGDIESGNKNTDEKRVDQFALKMLIESKEDIVPHYINFPHHGLVSLSAQSFIFFQNALLEYRLQLDDDCLEEANFFRERAMAIEEYLKNLNLPTEDIRRLNVLSKLMQSYFLNVREVIDKISPLRGKIIEFGYKGLDGLINDAQV